MAYEGRAALLLALDALVADGDLPTEGTRLEASLVKDGLALRVNGKLRLTPMGLRALAELKAGLEQVPRAARI